MNKGELEKFKETRMCEALYWFSEGYTIQEIANEMNLNYADAANRLHEARVVLRACDNDELVVKALILGVIEKRRDLI